MPSRALNQKIAVSVVYVAAMFMAIMDATIVNVALPTLGRQFHVAPDAVDTVAIGFLVSLAVFIPVSGWLGDRLGGRRVLLGSIVLFTGASALCGLASSLTELVLFRVLQGVGGGLMTPVGMAMLFRVFPPAERVRASAILTIPTAFAPALGPVLGGLLVTDASWRWVFYVNVPIGMLALVFGLLFLQPHRERQSTSFDLKGFLLAAVGLGLVMYGVSEGPIKGWGATDVVSTVSSGVVLLAALVVVELRTESPMIDLRLLENRLFRSTNAMLFVASAGFIGMLYLLALFYQDGLGLSPLQSGLSTFPEALGVMLGAQAVSRRLYPRFGPRRLMAVGLVVAAGAMLLLTLIGPSTSLWWARGAVLMMGLGMSGVFVPSQAAAFATISPAATGRASTVFNTQRQLGGAIGVAALTSVLVAVDPTQRRAGHLVAHLAAYRASFAVAAATMVVGSLVALSVRDSEAASTMRPRARRGAAGSQVEPAAAEPATSAREGVPA